MDVAREDADEVQAAQPQSAAGREHVDAPEQQQPRALPAAANAPRTEILPSPRDMPPYPGVNTGASVPNGVQTPLESSAKRRSRSEGGTQKILKGRGGRRFAKGTRAAPAPAPAPTRDIWPRGALADLASLGIADAEEELALEALNNDYCNTCQGHGRFLCCDGCPRSFHFCCVNPPLDVDEMPFPNGTLLPKKRADAKSDDLRAMRADADDSWFCRVCFGERMPAKMPKRYGPFNVLLQHVEQENPSIFALPAEIRNYYKGVSTAADGAYVDSSSLRPLKLNRNGFIEERDPFQLRNKHGDAALCYHCGGSALPLDLVPRTQRTPTHAEELAALDTLASTALDRHRPEKWRRMLSCDFCSLHWHLDCIDPPLTGMPSATRRWRCPAHSELAEPKLRIPRNVHQMRTVDVPLCVSENEVGGKRRVLGEVEVLVEDDAWEDAGPHSASIHYRIPERTIRLEFWQRARLEREAGALHVPDTKVAEVVRAAPLPAPLPAPPSAALDRLVAVALQLPSVPKAEKERLLEPELWAPAVLEENAAASTASLDANMQPFHGAVRTTYRASDAEPLSPTCGEDCAPHPAPVAPPPAFVYHNELAELRAIKRLMAAKGADALRRFLHEP